MSDMWIVSRNADLTEGRGPMIPVAGFLSASQADIALTYLEGCYGKGFAGTSVLPLFVDGVAFIEWAKDENKRNAMKKLTKAERVLLGLPENI